MYKGYVIEVKDLKPHSNADRLQVLTVFGTTTCVSLDVKVGDLGIYFPADGQLSIEFCEANHLCRRKQDGTPDTGYMDPDKRNVTAIKLRGEKSDGIYLPIECLAFTGVELEDFKPGDTIDVVNKIEICKKYIPRSNKTNRSNEGGNRTRKHTIQNTIPYFKEHVDTPQLRFSLNKFKPGDYICITEKLHGTSSRNGNCLVISEKRNVFQKLFHLKSKEKTSFKNIVGTRRTIVSDDNNGYYGTNEFRKIWGDKFINKLNPGEEVFGEIVGFYEPNKPIMPIGNNKKVNDKKFIAKFGDTTTFSYGCSEIGFLAPLNRYFIYRMTYTTENGYSIEYPWDLVQLRAEQMGFEVVPELERFIYTTEEDFLTRVNKYLDQPSLIDPRHIREGVVIRRLNSALFDVAKEKSYNFKVLEGITKTNAEIADMEEIEETL